MTGTAAKPPASRTRSPSRPALFRLVRCWSRRWTTRASEELTGRTDHVPHILVVEAVDAAYACGTRAWQRLVFEELTAAWDPRDRRRFAAYLERLAGELGV